MDSIFSISKVFNLGQDIDFSKIPANSWLYLHSTNTQLPYDVYTHHTAIWLTIIMAVQASSFVNPHAPPLFFVV